MNVRKNIEMMHEKNSCHVSTNHYAAHSNNLLGRVEKMVCINPFGKTQLSCIHHVMCMMNIFVVCIYRCPTGG